MNHRAPILLAATLCAVLVPTTVHSWGDGYSLNFRDPTPEEELESQVEEQQHEIEMLQRVLRKAVGRPNAEDLKIEAMFEDTGLKDLDREAMRDVLIEALRGS